MTRGALPVMGLALLFATLPAQANDRVGPARVIDGNTVEVGGTRLKLAQMDAPALGQSCSRFDARYNCGREAAEELGRIIEGHPLRCTPAGNDTARGPLYRCWAGDLDVGRELVRRGWAIVANGYLYSTDENRARETRRGLWAGDFQRPADWRRERKLTR